VDGNAMSTFAMAEQDRQLSNLVTEQRARLRNFIRKRVPNEADADDLLQEVFYELVRAHRLLLPIDVATAWLFRVARNRITDFFRKKRPEPFAEAAVQNEEGEWLALEELLPSAEEGPEAAYLRRALLEAMQVALRALPTEQREVFVAHEIEGRSFKELAEESGVNMNTLLARKRYAVLALRERLQAVHDEFLRR
jgi:RNA polymerase sigma factor (sigma-70 family)